jgi:hypothetical protein
MLRWSLAACWIAWLACVAAAAAVGRSLYGDGAWLVLSQLSYPMHYNDYDVHRSFASFITQTPILVGERFGVKNVSAYAALYSVGIQLLPAVLFLTALSLSRAFSWLFVATAAAIAVFGFGMNFVNSEANLLLPLAWLSAVLLILPGPRPILRGYVLPMVAFVLLLVYEGMLLTGPVLATGAFLAARGDRQGTEEKIGLMLSTMLFTIATFIGFSSFVAPRDPVNAASFVQKSFAYLHNPQAFMLASVLASIVCAAARKPRQRLLWMGASFLLALVFVWKMVRLHDYYGYRVYAYNRTFLVFLLPVAITSLLVVHRHRAAWLEARTSALAMAAMMVPFVAVVVIDLLGSARWMGYMRTFCEVLEDPASASRGIDRLKRSGAVTGWTWNHPSLSILLRRTGSDAVVVNDPGQWEPFDPKERRRLEYRGACENRRFASGQ